MERGACSGVPGKLLALLRILELLESLDQAEEGQQPGLSSGTTAGVVAGGGQTLGGTWADGCETFY